MALTRTGAAGAGLLLFVLPFLQSGLGDAAGDEQHMDHSPHHGGSLLMLGDHHLEIVARGETIEVYLSDALRRPLRSTFASVAFDGAAARELAWKGYRLVASQPPGYAWAEYRLGIPDQPALTIRLPTSGVTMTTPVEVASKADAR